MAAALLVLNSPNTWNNIIRAPQKHVIVFLNRLAPWASSLPELLSNIPLQTQLLLRALTLYGAINVSLREIVHISIPSLLPFVCTYLRCIGHSCQNSKSSSSIERLICRTYSQSRSNQRILLWALKIKLSIPRQFLTLQSAGLEVAHQQVKSRKKLLTWSTMRLSRR